MKTILTLLVLALTAPAAWLQAAELIVTGSPVIGAETFLAGGAVSVSICTVRRN